MVLRTSSFWRWRHGFDDDNDDGDGDDRLTAMMDGKIQIDADSDRGGGGL